VSVGRAGSLLEDDEIESEISLLFRGNRRRMMEGSSRGIQIDRISEHVSRTLEERGYVRKNTVDDIRENGQLSKLTNLPDFVTGETNQTFRRRDIIVAGGMGCCWEGIPLKEVGDLLDEGRYLV
jgi:hypothetical protein